MGAPGGTVLVVDDNAENRAFAEATLEDEGYRVVLASSGADGISAFAEHHPDCVLLDIRMPGIDGVTACEQIRALPAGADVAIIFATAQRDLDTFDRAVAAGGDDFLTKPFRPGELVVRVQTAMRLRRMAAERSELYAEIKRQRDSLLRLQLHQEQLVAFVVHDLKNPVGSIELQAQLVLRDKAASPRSLTAAARIQDEVATLMRMITNLLDISRSDEGQLAPAIAQLDSRALVAAVLAELAHRATAARVTLATDHTPCVVRADPDLIHRVLANLLENAIRHAPEGSMVTVRVRPVGREIELRVEDQGVGVPVALRAEVFERFQRGGGAAAEGANRGLGLAFCKIAVEAHGGTIHVEDGRPGAVFCVRLAAGD